MALTESAVAVMLPTKDAARAQEFYEDRLGLPFAGSNETTGETTFRLSGGSQLVLRLLPDAAPSPNTAMSFEVDDIGAEIATLEGRGVAFEDYDLPGFATVDHILDQHGMKAAWFLDPDGNVLCLHQPG
ncbi:MULTISPECIES: VOC family protein [unclassified Nocardioides]|uniref:VOC family protein n=1 Tax=unclassified Nocardioides TaxID=2615069 RepID=UPI000057107C|nr:MULTISPECIES: VOC family protein [unclassified Nocardioides]ABL80486.1 Glyoxalase/bleomycin resistance protein/dioxygenase [Nocardioides sp. JS614]